MGFVVALRNIDTISALRSISALPPSVGLQAPRVHGNGSPIETPRCLSRKGGAQEKKDGVECCGEGSMFNNKPILSIPTDTSIGFDRVEKGAGLD